ncbi:MAG: 2-oxoacid:acceptor oxidoreductase family protein [Chloroflexota bacterium]|nr:2-oxoacid:acceptor oxidoreductase family protein [Chloroflexota bacterium]
MQEEIIISVFGGQGQLFAGQLLAYAGMMEGRKVAWIPSYGPEMRGGTANCTVIIGDEDVGSPVVLHPSAVVAMNPPSLDKYEPAVAPGGVLVINTSLGSRAPRRSDLRLATVNASEQALQAAGNDKLANMVALGTLLALLPVVSGESVLAALKKVLGAKKANLYEANEKALRRGIELGRAQLT